MDKKKVRDQARKVTNDMKSSAKGVVKAVKKSAANAADNAAYANDEIAKKVDKVKDSILRTAQKAQADTKVKIKKADEINRDIAARVDKGVKDIQNSGNTAARYAKRH